MLPKGCLWKVDYPCCKKKTNPKYWHKLHDIRSGNPRTQIVLFFYWFQVFDDVAVELTMALLQYLNSGPDEEQLFRVLKALARFCTISGQEVPQLIQMIGPDPNKFSGASERVNEQIQIINSKIR